MQQFFSVDEERMWLVKTNHCPTNLSSSLNAHNVAEDEIEGKLVIRLWLRLLALGGGPPFFTFNFELMILNHHQIFAPCADCSHLVFPVQQKRHSNRSRSSRTRILTDKQEQSNSNFDRQVQCVVGGSYPELALLFICFN